MKTVQARQPKEKLFRLTDLLKRAHDAQQRVMEADRKASCSDCGRCCKETTHLSIWVTDPNYDAFMSAVEGISHPESHIDRKPHGILLTLDDGCPFLDRQTNACTVYDVRPMICRIYPFMPINIAPEGMPEDTGVILTSQCPVVAEIREHDIDAVLLSDIRVKVSFMLDHLDSFVRPDEDREGIEFMLRTRIRIDPDTVILLRFLGSALQEFVNAIPAGNMFVTNGPRHQGGSVFLAAEGEILFPIF